MSTETSNEKANFANYPEQCDRCGVARAQKRVSKGLTVIYFCNHHYNMHALALAEQGWSTENDSTNDVEQGSEKEELVTTDY